MLKGKTAKILFLIVAVSALSGLIRAQSTAFTFQGSLEDGSGPANGSYDFEFRLFDQGTDGSQIGPTVTVNGVSVVQGSFSVSLDFGPGFPGDDRWLEMAVRESVTPMAKDALGTYTVLSPRQPVTSVPYAMKSLTSNSSTNTLQLGGIDADQFVITTDTRLSDARTPTSGSADYIQNGLTPQSSSNFNISGTGTAQILGAAESFSLAGNRFLWTSNTNNIFLGHESGLTGPSGTRNTFVGFRTGKLTMGASDNVFVGSYAGEMNTGFPNAALGYPGGRNTFIGSQAGRANSDGSMDTYVGAFAGNSATGTNNNYFGFESGIYSTGYGNSFFGTGTGSYSNGDFNSFFGSYAGKFNDTGSSLSILGYAADVGASDLTNATAIGARAQVDASNSIVLGAIAGINNAKESTRVGIGTTAPERTLHVKGPGAQEIMVESSDANGRKWTIQASGDPGIGRFEIVDRTAASSRMAILSDGKVGIGITTPQNRFHVNGALQVSAGRFTPTGNAVTLSSESTFDALQSWNNRPLAINGSGNNVGIGTTAPSEKLEISVNSSSILFGGAGCPSGSVSIGLNGAFGNCTNFSVRGTGTDLIINRPSGAGILFRENNGASQVRINSGGALQLNTLGSAGATALCRNASNEVATCSSSARYKSNIESYLTGTEILNRLRPVTFNWKDGGMLDIGLVAEEVADIDPLLVTFNTKGQVEGVKYDRIGVVLVNVFREQQNLLKGQNEKLRMQDQELKRQANTVRSLEERLSAQENELAAMKALVCASNPGAAVCRQ